MSGAVPPTTGDGPAMDAAAFELTEAQLRARRGMKWSVCPPDALPAWIADMDFAVAPAITAAVARLCATSDFGYAARDGGRPHAAVARAFAARMRDRYGWDADPADAQVLTDLVQALFTSVVAFTAPGETVIAQAPHYGPFREAVETTGRRLALNPLVDAGTRWELDLDGLERLAAAPDARALIVCNPHNPTGRVLERGELEAIAAIAAAHDLTIVSDEVHADLVLPGARHIPLATLPDAAPRTVTLTSATKAFNLGGLRCAVAHFSTAALRERYHRRVPARMHGGLNTAAVDATLAAWSDGEGWLRAVLDRLAANRATVMDALATIPGVRAHAPEGTYLAWLDCRPLTPAGDTAGRLLLERARVKLSDGVEFGDAYGGYARLNFATSPTLLERILGRIASAARSIAGGSVGRGR